MNKIKKNLVIALSLSMLACGVVGVTSVNNAETVKADSEAKFEMESGAAVRIAQTTSDKSGIRWQTTLNETFYNTLNVGNSAVELGVLVAPEKNIAEGTELTISTPEVDPIPCTKEISFDSNGEFTYYSSIVYDSLTETQALKAYAVELTARAYIKIGENYTYVDEYNTTRSMRAVAYEALNNGYTQEQVGKYFGNEKESAIASGYYSEMDAFATLTNVNNLANGTYAASVKAQPVSVTVNGATMAVSGSLKGLTAGQNYELNVFDSSNNVYVQDFTYVTLAIDEASDLDYFYLGNERSAEESTWTAADKFDGYYVLLKDVDCTGYTFGANKEDEGENPCNLTGSGSTGVNSLKNMGLTGTFDGRGYAITNFMPNGAGLFAAINGGTVKNVSISKCNDEWTFFQSGGSYLATVLRDATVENVYIYASRALMGGTYGFARFVLGNSVIKNCVINANAHTSAGGNTFRDFAETASFENTYVINQHMLSNEVKVDASNCVSEGDTAVAALTGVKRYASVPAMIEDKANNSFASFNENYWDTTSGIPIWKNSDAAVVLCDAESNAVAETVGLTLGESVTFTAYKYGVVCDEPKVELISGESVTIDGAKITATAAGDTTLKVLYAAYGISYEKEIVVSVARAQSVYENTLTFSAKDGLFFDGQGNVVSLASILGEGVELISATHATDTLTVSDGAILGLTTSGTTVTNTQIVLNAEVKSVTVNVNAYTLAIDEASDLDMFHLGSDRWNTDNNWTEADRHKGYYILVKNIDCTDYVFGDDGNGNATKNLPDGGTGGNNCQNMGLMGTFDGNGYAITNFDPLGTGLFAAINGGTVKNVSISSSGSLNNSNYFIAAIVRNATFENVHLDPGTMGNTGTLLFRIVVGSTFKNCVFETLWGVTQSSIGHTFHSIQDTAASNNGSIATTFSDCYLLANGKPSFVGNTWDASNCISEEDTTTIKLNGLKRYISAETMIQDAANNDFTAFNQTNYWDTTSGMPVWKMKN